MGVLLVRGAGAGEPSSRLVVGGETMERPGPTREQNSLA